MVWTQSRKQDWDHLCNTTAHNILFVPRGLLTPSKQTESAVGRVPAPAAELRARSAGLEPLRLCGGEKSWIAIDAH